MVNGGASEPRTTKKDNQWHSGMKDHIGVDADGGLVHAVVGTCGEAKSATRSRN
jgi:IS5 family transposase